MDFCTEGFAGCIGRAPLAPGQQCRKHRLFARVKAKMEASKGEGEENGFIKAVNAEKIKSNEDFSRKVINKTCKKDCCDNTVTIKASTTPGMAGLKPYFQSPQPLSTPSRWDAAVTVSCLKECCVSTVPVLKLHEQVSPQVLLHEMNTNAFRLMKLYLQLGFIWVGLLLLLPRRYSI